MSRTITYHNMLALLLEAIPEFHPDREDVTDNLVYLVLPDLMLLARRELEVKQSEQLLTRVFAFLEEVAQSQDARVTEVLRDALHNIAIPDPDKFKALMGRSTRKLFKEVVKEVYG